MARTTSRIAPADSAIAVGRGSSRERFAVVADAERLHGEAQRLARAFGTVRFP